MFQGFAQSELVVGHHEVIEYLGGAPFGWGFCQMYEVPYGLKKAISGRSVYLSRRGF